MVPMTRKRIVARLSRVKTLVATYWKEKEPQSLTDTVCASNDQVIDEATTTSVSATMSVYVYL